MQVGSHISIRHGYLAAARTAVSIGANAFQYFPKNPRSLTVKPVPLADAQACAAYSREHGLLSIAHTPYPTNLAVPEGRLLQATADSLRNDLNIAEACGSLGIVVHFGKFQEEDPLEGYRAIIRCLNLVLDGWEGRAKLLLENQAGEGKAMGTTLRELAQIRSLADHSDSIGFCLDTCHFFAAGQWNGSNWAECAAEGEEIGYWDHLTAVHLNDSVYASGSGRDRHAAIGRGHIGEKGFLKLLQYEPIRRVPLILETGAGPDGTHRDEIAYVHTLARRTAN